MTTWNKGKPPSIGWWPASICRDRQALRFWNGSWWSDIARRGESKARVIAASSRAYGLQDQVQWCARWWEEPLP